MKGFETASGLNVVLKGFTGAGMGENGSLGYFNAKGDRIIDIRSSEHTPPSTKLKGSFKRLKKAHRRTRTNE